MSGLEPNKGILTPNHFDDWDLEYRPDLPTLPAVKGDGERGTKAHTSATESSMKIGESSSTCGIRLNTTQTPAEGPSSISTASPTPIPQRDKIGYYPALFHRSGLFGVAKVNSASNRSNEPIKSQGTYDLISSGPRLTMHDKSVWEALVDIAKEQDHDLAKPLRTSLSEVARRCGAKFTGSRVTKAVSDGIQRMCMTSLTVRLGWAGVVSGRLLAGFTSDSHGTSILFDPCLATALLGSDLNFKIDAARRRRLDTALAQWLHDFISTHEEGRSITLGYLRELSGFTANAKRFPANLNATMLDLKEHAPGLVLGFSITKSTRSSDHWTLSIQRGPEAPSFVGYRPPAKHASSNERKGPKRGGVVL